MAINQPTYSDGSWAPEEKVFNVANIIHGYNLMIFIGVILCFLGIVFFWRRMKYSWTILQIMLMIAIPSGIFGARLWTVIWDGGWSNFFNFAGLSIQGAVLAGMIFTCPYVWYVRRQVDFRTVYAIVIPNILIAQGIGRFGNFFNHELYGGIVSGESLNWMGAMKQHMFIRESGDIVGHYRAPMFLYESMTSFAGWLILVPFLLRKNWLRPGVEGALYWVWYGIWRLIFEPMKGKLAWIDPSSGFHIADFISGLSIAVGVLLAIYWQWFSRPLKLVNLKNAETAKKFARVQKIYDKWNNIGWVKNVLQRPRDYEKITPVKPRRKYELFGPKTDNKKKYILWGPEVPNKVILWIPIEREEVKWSKKEIRQGHRNKK